MTTFDMSRECHNSHCDVLQPGSDAVSLLENVALISEGTTGLVTWEAALYLAEWALDHQHNFTSRYKILSINSQATTLTPPSSYTCF